MSGNPDASSASIFARCLSELSSWFSRIATMAPALMPEWKIVWNQAGKAL